MALDLELAELRLSASVFNLLEDEVEDSGHDSHLLHGEAHSAARAHRVRLTATCLSISQNRRVVTCEAPKDEVSRANLINVVLFRFWMEDRVEIELVVVHLDLVPTCFDARPAIPVAQLAPH